MRSSKIKAPRAYRLGRRAEQQEETRRKIVEAAVDLHGSIGPALTNVSMVAERAGVQRHTFYAHFPDERSLFLACSGLAMARDPLPDAQSWRAIADPAERLTAGFRALYGWYKRNADLVGCVLRDSEHHELTREICELRMAPSFRGYREALGTCVNKDSAAMLRLMLSFHSWRTLVRDAGLGQEAVVRAAVQAVLCSGPKAARAS